MKQDNMTPCPKCHCMTKSIRKRRAYHVCEKCNVDKTLSDVYFYEATHLKTQEVKK